MQYTEISASQFIEDNKHLDLTVVDVRTPAEHLSESMESSISIPLDLLSEDELSRKIDKNQPVYLLCQSGKRAFIACEKLRDYSGELVVIGGGMNALKQMGFRPQTPAIGVQNFGRRVRMGALVVIGGIFGFGLIHLFSN